MKLGLKLPLGDLAQPPTPDAPPAAAKEHQSAAAAAGGGGEEDEWDDDDQFGVLQAPAERPTPTYDIKNFAFLNPVVDKQCAEQPFPRRERPPSPPQYFAGNLKVNHKAEGKQGARQFQTHPGKRGLAPSTPPPTTTPSSHLALPTRTDDGRGG
eukprot:CAMPEP_0174915648 /NCGR_PEP_ID=MMETSP1355-20121228/1249_1 /TAXON_ID=464990 /ORGANISM="Hemiselmis tepida, Strain CCMP443" /LENGTH=153 /DNA_ID=CAMNT_0016160565 /DNA_START=110 /DNA_END=568 /DNA_ORIENTATION=+